MIKNLTIYSIIIALLFLFNSPLSARPMCYEDIVAISKPQSLAISPEGSKVAFVTRKGSLEENRNIDTFHVNDIQSKRQESIFAADHIMQISWGRDASTLYFLVHDGDTYRIIRHALSGTSVLLSTPDPIGFFTLSPNESRLYYTLVKYIPDEIVRKSQEEGYVYKWGNDTALTLFNHTYRNRELEEIWSIDLKSLKTNFLTSLPYSNWIDREKLIENLQVSENERYLLLSINTLGRSDLGEYPFSRIIAVWDIAKGEWALPLSESLRDKFAPIWLNGRQFVYYEEKNINRPSALWLYDLDSKSNKKIEWFSLDKFIDQFICDKEQKILYGIGVSSIFRISMEEKTVESISLPEMQLFISPSFDATAHSVAFVSESSNTPPEISVYHFDTQKSTCLTKLNPQLDGLLRGHVEEINEQTKTGLPIHGYLVHPINEQPGKRYPIIIATYGFHGQYIADAEWHSSFPAQPLAAEGYLILLLNVTGCSQNLIGDSAKAREIEGWNALSVFEEAVDLLVKRGGDPTKVGLYGWSHGAFIVNFLISHSQKFHAACQGEGGDYNPGGFWFAGTMSWPRIYENTFGGPPWGHSLQNYLNYSPFFQVDKIKTPLLMESVRGIDAFEMYVPLRYLGVPAELVVYNEEEHNFVKPKARIASMARKTDWLNFWLLDKRDPDPAKQEHYAKWEQMRSLQK